MMDGKRLSHERLVKARRLRSAIKRFNYRFRKGGEGLWDHQNHAMAAVNRFLRDSRQRIMAGETCSGAIIMPTGAGKTVLAAEIVKALGVRSLILSPTVRIALQHMEELQARAPEMFPSLYGGGSRDLTGRVIVSTYQSAVQLMNSGRMPNDIGIMFPDEAHRSISPERLKLHGAVAPLEIGLTATPAFSERRHIWSAFNRLIYEMKLPEAVESGILSPLRGFIVETKADVRNVRLLLQGEQLDVASAEKHLNVLARNLAARDFYLEGFNGVPAVAFCITKRHAEDLARLFSEAGIRAAFVHCDLSNREREMRIGAFERGDLDVLTSRDVLIEGWDSKRLILGMNLRPTYSRVVKSHMVGRVMRAREGKEAGIFVEFQDIYGRGQQPVLVHHLLDNIFYRDGGLIAAPKKMRKSEEKRIRKGEDVHVVGTLPVSIKLRQVVRLDSQPTGADLTDLAVIRDILSGVPGLLDGSVLPSELLAHNIKHPLFTGNLRTLMHRAFGIVQTSESRLNTDDLDHFLWMVMEDERLAMDKELVRTEDMLGHGLIGKHTAESSSRKSHASRLLSRTLRRAFDWLHEDEQRILFRRYFDNAPFGEIAEQEGFGDRKHMAWSHRDHALKTLKDKDSELGLGEFLRDDTEGEDFDPYERHFYRPRMVKVSNPFPDSMRLYEALLKLTDPQEPEDASSITSGMGRGALRVLVEEIASSLEEAKEDFLKKRDVLKVAACFRRLGFHYTAQHIEWYSGSVRPSRTMAWSTWQDFISHFRGDLRYQKAYRHLFMIKQWEIRFDDNEVSE